LGATLVTVLCGTADAADFRWLVELTSDQHLDALRLDDLDRDDLWSRLQPRRGRNLGYVRNEVRATLITAEPWRWSLLARQRALAVVSQGALELARTVQTGAQPPDDTRWQVQVDYLGFAGAGGEVARLWSLGSGWQLELGLQALMLTRLHERRGSGQASYDSLNQQYGVDLDSLETKKGLRYPFQRAYDSHGEGLLSRGSLAWRGESFDLGWRWADAGVLTWQGLPQQALRLNSDIRGVDSNGFVVYAPLITGQNSQSRFVRRLRPFQSLDIAWREPGSGRWKLGLDVWPGYGRSLPSLAWQSSRSGDWRMGLGWRLHERRAELSLDWRDWSLHAGADVNGRSRWLGLGWQASR
jgi:hypothetical protein